MGRCKWCGKSIYYVPAVATKNRGWFHLGFTRGVADWVLCSGKGAAVPA